MQDVQDVHMFHIQDAAQDVHMFHTQDAAQDVHNTYVLGFEAIPLDRSSNCVIHLHA